MQLISLATEEKHSLICNYLDSKGLSLNNKTVETVTNFAQGTRGPFF